MITRFDGADFPLHTIHAVVAYGGWLHYDDDGHEFRSDREVRRIAKKLAARRVPITTSHEDGAQIVGLVTDAWCGRRTNSMWVVAEMLLNDHGMRALARGKRECSLAYAARRDAHNYQHVGRIEHIALGVAGRNVGPYRNQRPRVLVTDSELTPWL